MSDELHVMASMTCFDTVDTDGVTISCVAGLAAVEVVHRERCVTRDFVQTLAVAHRFLHCVLIAKYFVDCNHKKICCEKLAEILSIEAK